MSGAASRPAAGARAGLADLVAACAGRRVAVIGDVMLDRYVYGRVRRVSPEAPVPVVEQEDEAAFPGGTANVAANVAALGGAPLLVGAVGRDQGATDLRRVLEDRGIGGGHLVAVPGRPTTEKVRFVANRQQLLRLDREKCGPLSLATLRSVERSAERAVARADAVILEDYGKGVVTAGLVRAVCRSARRKGIPVVFDPKEDHRLDLRGVTVATPNRREAFVLAGLAEPPPADPVLSDTALRKAGRALVRAWGCEHLLVTLGERGMCLFGPGRRPWHVPAATREVYDVSGAGDTVAATVALALAAGGEVRAACALANHAAGIVVAKLGTASASPDEILGMLET